MFKVGFHGRRAGSLQRVRSFRSTSASAAGGPLGVRKLSRSFDRKRVETIARVSLISLCYLCCIEVTTKFAVIDQLISGPACWYNSCLPPGVLRLLRLAGSKLLADWLLTRWHTQTSVRPEHLPRRQHICCL